MEGKDTIEDLAIDFSVKMALESRKEEGRQLRADEIEDLIRRCCRESQRALIACLQSMVLNRSEVKHNYFDSWMGRRSTFVIIREEKERIERHGHRTMNFEECLSDSDTEDSYHSLLLSTFQMLQNPCDFKDTERRKAAKAWKRVYESGGVPDSFKFESYSQKYYGFGPSSTPTSSFEASPSSALAQRKISSRPSPSTAMPVLEDLVNTLKREQRCSSSADTKSLLEICRKLQRDLLRVKIDKHQQGQQLNMNQRSTLRSSVSRIYSIKDYSQRVKLLQVAVHLRYALGHL